MMQKKQHVTIKGTKDGLIFLLDDRCSYESLIDELVEKLSAKHYQQTDGPDVQVKVDVGFRYLDEKQREEIQSVITGNRNLAIQQFDSKVLTKVEAEQLKQESQMVTLTKIIRSGQVLKVKGDLFLIGDVNPGGTVMATGNIFILGSLKGLAHAGYTGNERAVISASLMAPTQLRIAEVIHQFTEKSEELVMECAYLHEESSELILERVQQLVNKRPELSKNQQQIID
ncbi:septum site-determining protein MinC [Halalkalibacter urbisdiaboli]|uniref:septum site-determining protein MinC n=1 Tax=Halalkalibacter urbisdiaboli TaxID=1960589 RepID=UPI000B446035|nr:septum site-determining protein MinC [Halalkalibacter urbisdiaboli]